MENNLNKWFDAATRIEPVMSIEEVEAMISQTPKGGFSTLQKNTIMGTVFCAIVSCLIWFWMPRQTKQEFSNKTVAETPKQTSSSETVTEQAVQVGILPPHKPESTVWVQQNNAPGQKLDSGNTTAESTDIPKLEPSILSQSNGYSQSETVGSFDDNKLYLSHEELAQLGIITDGNTLRYLTQFDTTVYHFDNQSKPTVFAFSVNVTTGGGVVTNNIHALDDELKKLSNSAVPLVVSTNEISEDAKENDERFLIAEQNTVPIGYRTEYISRIKADLVPVRVITNGSALVKPRDYEIVFWYKSNDQFWQKLPDWARVKVQANYPLFNEEKHRKLIQKLRDKDKQAREIYSITPTEIEKSQTQIIDLTPQELKKLNVLFNGKKLTYQLMSRRPDSSLVMIDLLVTPDMFSLNIRGKSGKPIRYKWAQNYTWYITDTLLGIKQNFVDPIGGTETDRELLNKNMERMFKERLPEMIPVRIRFDDKAVKKAKYKHPQTVLLFWFPETEAFIKALPERIQTQLGVNISSLNRTQTKPLKYIELTDEQLDKLGIKRNPESITVPIYTGNGKYMFSDYSSKGTVFHVNSMTPTTGDLESPKGGIRFQLKQGGSVGIAPPKLEPPKYAYPSPLLITEGNGLHWLTYQIDEEMSKEDHEYMMQNGLSPIEYKPMLEAKKRGEEKLTAALNTYIALKVKSNEKPSGERNPDLIIWYKPDSLFFAALPNELSAQIQQELNHLNLKQSESGCQFFEACQSIRGTIGQCIIYPNPTTGPIQIKMELLEPRRVSIFLTDISGKKVKDFLLEETLSKGAFEHQLTLEGLAEGMYLVHVITNKGEYIVQRVIRKE